MSSSFYEYRIVPASGMHAGEGVDWYRPSRGHPTVSKATEEEGLRYGFVIDQTTCIGCHACTVACKTEHQVPLGVNRTWVKYVEQGTWPDTMRSFSIMRCNQCTDAPCVAICPTSSLHKRSDGIVDFDTSICIGCKSCMQACPYDALYIDPHDHTAQKCNYCVHRVEIGIEPACVIVCPEKAIIAGDLDDPGSRIAAMVASGTLTQRAVERGTKPNVWYKGAEPANLAPLAATRTDDGGIWRDPAGIENSWLDVDLSGGGTDTMTPSRRVTDDAGHPRVVYATDFPMPWGWRVSSYFLTKAISAGIAIAALVAVIFGVAIESMWMRVAAPLLGGLLLLLTGVLLVLDLKRPDRFYYLLTKGNPSSWLVRGAWILTAQAIAFAAWFLAGAFQQAGLVRGAIWVSAIIGFGTAGYTAFLFAQARGRQLWNGPLLVWHMIAAALTVGGGISLIASLVSETSTEFGATEPLTVGNDLALGTEAFTWTMLIGAVVLGIVAAFEAAQKHSPDAARAYHHMTRGVFAFEYWVGLVFCVVSPTISAGAVLLGTPPVVGAGAGLAAMVGVWMVDDAFVKAGQSVPLT
jgi:Fe-S-cluster-containing dehydrogenase component/formate-dependent nitrite reductase membrane component NrfD